MAWQASRLSGRLLCNVFFFSLSAFISFFKSFSNSFRLDLRLWDFLPCGEFWRVFANSLCCKCLITWWQWWGLVHVRWVHQSLRLCCHSGQGEHDTSPMLTLVHDGTGMGGLALVQCPHGNGWSPWQENLEIERMAIVYFYAQNKMVGGGEDWKAARTVGSGGHCQQSTMTMNSVDNKYCQDWERVPGGRSWVGWGGDVPWYWKAGVNRGSGRLGDFGKCTSILLL